MASTIPIRTLETSSFDCRVQAIRTRVDRRLEVLVPAEGQPPHQLHKAIRYSLLARGKRIRPVVAVLATEQLGGDPAVDAAEDRCERLLAAGGRVYIGEVVTVLWTPLHESSVAIEELLEGVVRRTRFIAHGGHRESDGLRNRH